MGISIHAFVDGMDTKNPTPFTRWSKVGEKSALNTYPGRVLVKSLVL